MDLAGLDDKSFQFSITPQKVGFFALTKSFVGLKNNQQLKN